MPGCEHELVTQIEAAWAFLMWMSWNPLLTSVFGGGLFALLGAVVAGRYLLRAQKLEREHERLSASRALSAELELNTAAVASLAIAGAQKPNDYLVFRPQLLRAVFDEYLPLMSELLKPQEFQALVSLYARAAASFTLLETIARGSVPFTPGAVQKFSELAQEFAIASKAIAERVWPPAEQTRLNEVRAKLLSELRSELQKNGQ